MRLRGVWAACVGLLACVSAGQALAADRLARIQASGQVLVCIWPDYYGISLRDPRTLQLSGIDVDLAHELAHELGVAVQFVDSSFARLEADVLQERCDVAMFAEADADQIFSQWRGGETLHNAIVDGADNHHAIAGGPGKPHFVAVTGHGGIVRVVGFGEQAEGGGEGVGGNGENSDGVVG